MAVVGMKVRRDLSNGSCSGGNGGDKVPKGREGQGEEAGHQAGYPDENEGARQAWEGELCPILMLLLVPLQTETLLLQAERRALCACWPAGR